MKKRIYGQAERKRHTRWHKRYFQEHDYSTPDTQRKKYTWAEMYLVWNKKLQGGRILTDIEIAKVLSRSLQSIQLKRHKMSKKEYPY